MTTSRVCVLLFETLMWQYKDNTNDTKTWAAPFVTNWPCKWNVLFWWSVYLVHAWENWLAHVSVRVSCGQVGRRSMFLCRYLMFSGLSFSSPRLKNKCHCCRTCYWWCTPRSKRDTTFPQLSLKPPNGLHDSSYSDLCVSLVETVFVTVSSAAYYIQCAVSACARTNKHYFISISVSKHWSSPV